MQLKNIRELFLRKDIEEPAWCVKALDSYLTIFTKDSEEKPSRDGTCINWENIKKVTAYKADLFVQDLVCLVFEINTESAIEVNEEMLGFDSFLEIFPQKLSTFPARDKWWGDIVKTPFKANTTLIWERHDSPTGV